MTSSNVIRIGLIINPLAGLGGSVALKGSDGAATAAQALALGAQPQAQQRTMQALKQLGACSEQVQFYCGSDELGEQVLQQLGLPHQVVYHPSTQPSTAADTQAMARMFATEQPVDLLLFAGGDGTARDICAVYPDDRPVLGIPAGVKIHSGVYAISPAAAGKVLQKLVSGELTSVTRADVMDIDEEAFRAGTVRAKRYGEMMVPAELQYIQAVKMGGKESDELVLADIAADVIESMEDDTLYIMGSGSTVAAVMEELGLANTLLGVDVIAAGQLLAQDVTAKQLEALVSEHAGPVKLVITVIGGQGHIFGRGNQQLSPAVIRHVGVENIIVVATKRKLQQLNGRPLLVDTGDPELDQELTGLQTVTCGYHDQVLVRIAGV